MKAIMLTAPASGSGKTTVTLGLIRALLKKGMDVCGFKTGPDYIDRAFLEEASGKPAGNLDIHLQGENGLFYSLSQAPAELCVIEGAMGYFDGIHNTYENSCYHISQLLEINSILIYTPKGEMFTAVPKIKGMAEFKQSTIKAVIFNNVSKKYYTLLKEALEDHTNLKVLGYIPKLNEAVFESRHLGLVQSNELSDINRKINEIADAMIGHVDLEAVLGLMTSPIINKDFGNYEIARKDITVAVAQDKAFSFYYRENLQLLENVCDVSYFSPLRDHKIPPCDLIYLGGGYPEVFKTELSMNKHMLRAIRDFIESFGCVYAECGGLLYLSDSIENSEMAGIFSGKCQLTKSLQRFGYVDVKLKQDCLLGKKGETFTAHEFHKSTADIKGETLYTVSKTMGEDTWNCGYSYKNAVAGYPHVNFLGNIDIFRNILRFVEKNRLLNTIC